MKKNKLSYFISIIITALFFIVLFSCTEPERSNPFDPQSSYTTASMQGGLSVLQLNDSDVKLEWQLNPTVVGQYIIKRKINSGDYEIRATVTKDINSYIDTGLLTTNTYDYQLIGANGDVQTDPMSNSISTSFVEITNFNIQQENVFTAKLTWQHDCDYEEGYVIERQEIISRTINYNHHKKKLPIKSREIRQSTDKKVSNNKEDFHKDNNLLRDFIQIADLEANTFEFIDDTLFPNHTYEYRIYAYTEFNTSIDILESLLITISAPENLIYDQLTITTIELAWDDNSMGEEGFKIDKKVGVGAWQVDYALVAENEITWTDTNAEINEEIQYSVYAFRGTNNSISIFTGVIDNTIPAPDNLSYTIENISYPTAEVNLAWDYSASGIDGFKIKKNGTLLSEVILPGTTEWIDYGINIEDVITYQVQAVYQGYNSTSSNEVTWELPADMVLLMSGDFLMGDHLTEGDSDELPTHTVALDDYFIGKYEVTHLKYIEFLNDFGVSSDGSYNGTELIDMDDGECAIVYDGSSFYFEANDVVSSLNCPVIEITWFGAVVYCNWLSQHDGLAQCYNLNDWNCDFTLNGYRLPTEAEWEYAARGGMNWADNYRYSGCNEESDLGDYAWYDLNSNSQPQLVGTKQANQLGIYDLSGNVFEWCNDLYDSSYYSYSPNSNPTGSTSGSSHVVRGGDWNDNASFCRVANRLSYDSYNSFYNGGFRIARRP